MNCFGQRQLLMLPLLLPLLLPLFPSVRFLRVGAPSSVPCVPVPVPVCPVFCSVFERSVGLPGPPSLILLRCS